MEVLQRLLEIFSKIAGLLFNIPEFQKIRIIVSILGLLLSASLIGYWIYLERKYKYGAELWTFLIKYFLDAFIKPEYFKNEWKKIRNIFLADHFLALKETYRLLEEVIDLYGYEEGSLKEKFLSIPNQVYTDKERYAKALEVLEIIMKKIKKDEKIEINQREVLAVLKEIESLLKNLMVISPEDLWASFQVVQE